MAGNISDGDWELTESSNEVHTLDDFELSEEDSSSERHDVNEWELTESRDEEELGTTRLYDQKVQVESAESYSKVENYMQMFDPKEQVDYCKQEISKVEENLCRLNEEKLKGITEMVEQRLKETRMQFEQQLAEEQAACLRANELLENFQTKCSAEMRELKESLEEDMEDQLQSSEDFCVDTTRKLEEKTDSVEERLNEIILRFEEEQSARLKAEDLLENFQTKSSAEICKLKESLEEYMTDQMQFSEDFCVEEMQKLEEKTHSVEKRLNEKMLQFEQEMEEEQDARLKADISLNTSQARSVAKILKLKVRLEKADKDQMELEEYYKQEIRKVEEKTDMIEQRIESLIFRLEQQLKEERAARLYAEYSLEATIARCTSETAERVELLLGYSKQEIRKVEEILAKEQVARLEEQRFLKSVIFKFSAEISALNERLEKAENDKKEEAENYRLNQKKLEGMIEMVEIRECFGCRGGVLRVVVSVVSCRGGVLRGVLSVFWLQGWSFERGCECGWLQAWSFERGCECGCTPKPQMVSKKSDPALDWCKENSNS